jgi:serine/threonine protein kinase
LIADFGSALKVGTSKKSGFIVGTVGYIDPEVLNEKADFSLKSDIFSLGSIFYDVARGYNLFEGGS